MVAYTVGYVLLAVNCPVLLQLGGTQNLSEHPLVSQYFKGIYSRHPPLPKYVNIWDISLFLRY